MTFSTNIAFVAAINGRLVKIPHGDVHKRVSRVQQVIDANPSRFQVEIKPYMMDDQPCDNCPSSLIDDHSAPYFCGDVSCLMYLCEKCWDEVHRRGRLLHDRSKHKPFVRQGDQAK